MKQLHHVCALVLCAAAAAAAQSAAHTSPFFNVLDYGATPDGKTSSTGAFRAAIQACAKAGGGTVYVPAGHYVSGAIELVSNLTFYLDSGAVIRFAANRDEYPMVDSRFEGTELRAPAALLGGRNLENVTITGRGTLQADNAEWRALMLQPAYRTALSQVLDLMDHKQPVPGAMIHEAEMGLRPDFIRPVESKNILIEGIHILSSPMWVLHILYCENVVIRNVIVESFPGSNTDGVDIDS